MTNTIIKDFLKSALFKPVFLILLIIVLLLVPASAFASDDDSPSTDSSSATVKSDPSDQSGGFELSAPAGQFDSPAVFDQGSAVDFGNISADFSVETPTLETPSSSPSSSLSPLDEQLAPAENTGVGNSYTAEVTSERVVATGTENTSFTVMFTEVGDKTLGSVQLTLPEGFSSTTLDNNSIQAPEGKNWTGGVIDLVLKFWAENEGSYLEQGESVSAIFSATTPAESGVYTFTTQAWTDNSAADLVGAEGNVLNTNNMAAGFSDPTVGVLHRSNPFHVENAEQLALVGSAIGGWDLDKEYLQMANIDLKPLFGPDPDDHFVGWHPIGTAANPFTGIFDGNGYTISNLYISPHNTTNIGLFGYTGVTAELKNIKLENVDVDVRVDKDEGELAGKYVGGLVGYNNGGTISNSCVTGTITGYEDVGGLVGFNNGGTISNSCAEGTVTGYNGVGGLVGRNDNATIENCYTDVAVIGQDITLIGEDDAEQTFFSFYIGGLVGINSNGTIEACYAVGDVTGRSQVGGLTGHNFGTIRNSYAAGSVTGYQYVGGLVGFNNFFSMISNTYAYGTVTGNEDFGGLLGSNHISSTISNSFYDMQTTGQSDTGKGEPKTTAEMQTLATYTGWDIVGIDGSYPLLGWQVPWKDNIWYMGTPPTPPTPPVPDNTGGNGSFGGDFGSYDFDFTSALLTQLSTSLTALTGQGNAVITPGIIAYGSWNDFYQASAAYQAALLFLESNQNDLSPAKRALLEVELAIARAAILAMEARLLAAEGLPYNLAALQSAYAEAVATLNAHQSFLSADQLAAANQLLAAIAGVIAALQ